MKESNDKNEDANISGLDSVLDLVKGKDVPTPQDETNLEQVAEEQAQTKRFGRTLPSNFGDKVVQVDDVKEQVTETATAQPEVIPYTKPDGTTGTLELPADPEERIKKIASLASGTDAYEAGRDIVRDKAPELSDEWRGLLKVQQDTLKTIQDNQQQQSQQDYDPVKGLNADQRAYYEYLKEERGDDREAALFLSKEITQNLMIFEADQKVEEQKRESLRQKAHSRAKELRKLEPTLPNPTRGNEDSFQRSFYSGFGGWLLEQGFSENQIFFADNIDLDTLHKVYQTKSGQSQDKLSKSEDIKEPEAKAAVVAKATISPDVAKSIKDVSGGSLSASIGNNDPFAKYRDAKTRSELRRLDQQDGGKLGIEVLEGFGISRFFPKKR